MKAERRHDLQHNSLDAELAKGIDFFRKYANRILMIILGVAVVFAGWVYLDRRSSTNQAEAQNAYDQLKLRSMLAETNEEELIKGYQSLSAQSSIKWIAADSLLELGLIYTTKSLQAEEVQQRDRAVEQAGKYFDRVIVEFGDLPSMVAGAQMGLGKLAEGKGDFQKAREMYRAVIDTKALAGYPVVDQARLAEAQLVNLNENVVLAEALPAWAPKVETKPDEVVLPTLKTEETTPKVAPKKVE